MARFVHFSFIHLCFVRSTLWRMRIGEKGTRDGQTQSIEDWKATTSIELNVSQNSYLFTHTCTAHVWRQYSKTLQRILREFFVFIHRFSFFSCSCVELVRVCVSLCMQEETRRPVEVRYFLIESLKSLLIKLTLFIMFHSIRRLSVQQNMFDSRHFCFSCSFDRWCPSLQHLSTIGDAIWNFVGIGIGENLERLNDDDAIAAITEKHSKRSILIQWMCGMHGAAAFPFFYLFYRVPIVLGIVK